jgi:hypothetical protein
MCRVVASLSILYSLFGKGGAACSKTALDELSNHHSCDLCGKKGQVDYLDCVKVIFVFVPDILYYPVSLYDCPNDDDCPRNKEVSSAS